MIHVGHMLTKKEKKYQTERRHNHVNRGYDNKTNDNFFWTQLNFLPLAITLQTQRPINFSFQPIKFESQQLIFCWCRYLPNFPIQLKIKI